MNFVTTCQAKASKIDFWERFSRVKEWGRRQRKQETRERKREREREQLRKERKNESGIFHAKFIIRRKGIIYRILLSH